MPKRITFMVEPGTNRLYSHFIQSDGTCFVARTMAESHHVKVAVVGERATQDQLVTMASLCREALSHNREVAIEFMHGLSPYAEPSPSEGDLFTVAPTTEH